jgi:galactosamine-6-phosphate isomerase
MEVRVLDAYESLSREATSIVLQQLEQDPELLLCAATGDTPTGTYACLSREYEKRPDLFRSLRVLKLDEWGGIPTQHPGTCETYLRKHLTGPLGIDDARYLSFQSDPADPAAECRRIQLGLDRQGPVNLCILGLGMNGHIALNEPGDFLNPGIHVARLSASSLQHPMISGTDQKPAFGLTLGMAAILQSKLILLLVSGAKKRPVARALLSGSISTQLPASFLWLHPRVICLLDREAAPEG